MLRVETVWTVDDIDGCRSLVGRPHHPNVVAQGGGGGGERFLHLGGSRQLSFLHLRGCRGAQLGEVGQDADVLLLLLDDVDALALVGSPLVLLGAGGSNPRATAVGVVVRVLNLGVVELLLEVPVAFRTRLRQPKVLPDVPLDPLLALLPLEAAAPCALEDDGAALGPLGRLFVLVKGQVGEGVGGGGARGGGGGGV